MAWEDHTRSARVDPSCSSIGAAIRSKKLVEPAQIHGQIQSEQMDLACFMAAAQTAALCAQETALVRFFDNGKTVSQKTKDAPGTYLKFGDYLQAQDAQTGQQEAHENIRDFYRLRGIVSDRIVFENVKYERHE